MAFLFLSSAQNPGQYTESRPDSEYLHKNVDSGGSLNRTCLHTQLLSTIVAANYKGVRQTGIRDPPTDTGGVGSGAGRGWGRRGTVAEVLGRESGSVESGKFI